MTCRNMSHSIPNHQLTPHNMLYNSILTILGTVAFLTANGLGNASGLPASETGTAAARDSLAYEIRSFRYFSPYFVRSADGGVDSTVVTISFPVFAPEINALIRKTIFSDGESSPKEIADGFLDNYNAYVEEMAREKEPHVRTWMMDIGHYVEVNTGRLLTLATHVEEYSGGAHGLYASFWSNYDLAAKKKLELADVIQYPERLRARAEKIFRKQENLSPTASLAGDYFFENDAFALPDNFGLTEKGLLFYYNIYEIKAYVDGPTEILVPYSEIADILTEKGSILVKSISKH